MPVSSKINEQEVRHVAKLARLACTDEEITRLTAQLGAILDYVAQLQDVDTTDVEPLAHCLPISNVFRQDAVDRRAAVAGWIGQAVVGE